MSGMGWAVIERTRTSARIVDELPTEPEASARARELLRTAEPGVQLWIAAPLPDLVFQPPLFPSSPTS